MSRLDFLSLGSAAIKANQPFEADRVFPLFFSGQRTELSQIPKPSDEKRFSKAGKTYIDQTNIHLS